MRGQGAVAVALVGQGPRVPLFENKRRAEVRGVSLSKPRCQSPLAKRGVGERKVEGQGLEGAEGGHGLDRDSADAQGRMGWSRVRVVKTHSN